MFLRDLEVFFLGTAIIFLLLLFYFKILERIEFQIK